MEPRERGGARAEEFDELYNSAAVPILRQMLLLTGDAAEAEDVTQEAFERAWLHWSTVRRCESPEAWVRTVARRVAVSRWRRVRNSSVAWLRRESRTDPPPEISAENVAVLAALQSLPLAQRTAIVLYHFVDLPVARIAEETGCSVSAVKQQLVRGRAALASLLADEPTENSSGERPTKGASHD